MRKPVLEYVKRLLPGIWLGVALGAMGFALIHGGDDWTLFYRPAVRAGFNDFPGVANPTYILFLFLPLALLPENVGCALIVGSTFLAAWITEKLTHVNRWLIVLSYPALWMIMYAQIDAWVMLGAALGYWAVRNNKPYWQGAATLLLALKPQVGLPLALFYLWRQRNWRSIVVSLAVLAASMVILGPWPVGWIERILREIVLSAKGEGGFVFVGNSIGLYPYGLIFLLCAMFLPGYELHQRASALLAGTLLASPHAGYYSILGAMALPLPLSIYPLLSLPLIGRIGWWEIISILAIIFYPFGVWVYQKAAAVVAARRPRPE